MLHVCATPIGNLGDVTPRLLETLREVDLIAAEDTRHTRKLLSHFDIHTPTTSLFRHNEAKKTVEVLRLLREGKDVALVSDAGMPAVSDPGMRLIAGAIADGIALTVVPGPSAVLTALVAAGYEGAGFRFVGYLPRRCRELEEQVHAWRRCGGLVVAFDTAQRLPGSLACLASHVPDARAAICRELTKAHEEVVRGTVSELRDRYAGEARGDGDRELRGEMTLVLDLAAPDDDAVAASELKAIARGLIGRGLSKRDTAAALQACLATPHREAERLAREAAESR